MYILSLIQFDTGGGIALKFLQNAVQVSYLQDVPAGVVVLLRLPKIFLCTGQVLRGKLPARLCQVQAAVTWRNL